MKMGQSNQAFCYSLIRQGRKSYWALRSCKMAEVKAAQSASPGGDTIFGKIIRKELPADFLYEDDKVGSHQSPPNTTEHVFLLQESFGEAFTRCGTRRKARTSSNA